MLPKHRFYQREMGTKKKKDGAGEEEGNKEFILKRIKDASATWTVEGGTWEVMGIRS